MFTSFKAIIWWVLKRKIMFAIKAFIVARVTEAVVEEGCTTIAGEESKVEGEEKEWGFTIIVWKASKTKEEGEVCTLG